jgi:hypothetical protein
MAKYFLIGEDGDDAVWLVDLENKTVEKFDGDQLAAADVEADDLITNFEEVRKKGFSVIWGVNLAVAAHSRTAASGHLGYRSPH